MSNYSEFRDIVAETTVEITHYESLLEKLRTKRQSAQFQLDSIVYPVLTLPPEITSEIFLHCLPTSSSDRKWNSVDPHEAPMLLSHVCRTWRHTAISNPALWAKIALEIDDEPSVDLFKIWVSRIGGCPFSLKLDMEWDLGQDSHSAIFKDAFAEASRGMQSLELSIDVENVEALNTACTNWSFPSLHKFSICLPDAADYALCDLEEPSIEFTNVPLLREVSLIDTPPSFISLPWHQLTKFTGEVDFIGDCLQVLRLSPNLTECAFTAHLLNVVPPSPVIHSNLQSLTLQAAYSDPLHEGICSLDILQFVTLPALQALKLLETDAFEFNNDTFRAFLSRSSAPLRKFTIHLGDDTDFEAESLALMPTLVDLEIWNLSSFAVDEFLECLNGEDPSFLPRLKHLSFLGCESTSLAHDMFQLVLKSVADRLKGRDHGFAKLKSFRIVCASASGERAEDTFFSFNTLASGPGLDICIDGETTRY